MVLARSTCKCIWAKFDADLIEDPSVERSLTRWSWLLANTTSCTCLLELIATTHFMQFCKVRPWPEYNCCQNHDHKGNADVQARGKTSISARRDGGGAGASQTGSRMAGHYIAQLMAHPMQGSPKRPSCREENRKQQLRWLYYDGERTFNLLQTENSQIKPTSRECCRVLIQ